MVLRICLSLFLAAAGASDAASRISVSECIGVHGERVFSDTDCGAHGVRQWSLELPTSAPTSAQSAPDQPTRRRQGRARRATGAGTPDSYQCTSGGQSWYQHAPCRGKGEQGEPVRQSRVSRQHACREIARPAALLRDGSQRDERTGPYARAMGRDPCR